MDIKGVIKPALIVGIVGGIVWGLLMSLPTLASDLFGMCCLGLTGVALYTVSILAAIVIGFIATRMYSIKKGQYAEGAVCGLLAGLLFGLVGSIIGQTLTFILYIITIVLALVQGDFGTAVGSLMWLLLQWGVPVFGGILLCFSGLVGGLVAAAIAK